MRRTDAAKMALCLSAAMTGAASAGAGTTLYVDDDAPAGGDGATWATAHRFLQDALAAAAASSGVVSEIRVAQGVYRPDRAEKTPSGSGDRAASFFMQDGLAVIGGFHGLSAGKGESPDERDIAKFATVLSGDLKGDDGPLGTFENATENSYHVLVALNVDDTAVLDGFTVRGGYADGPGFGADPASQDQGSGLNIYYASPMVLNCTFEGNWNANHGAINDHGDESMIVTCTFRKNRAQLLGAGLYIHHETMTHAIGCQFLENSTPGQGAGLYTRSMMGAEVSKCVFIGNIAGDGGAGSYVSEESDTEFVGCQYADNVAGLGAGIYSHFASPMITGCVFIDNDTEGGGGGAWITGGAPVVADCAFVNNTGANSGGLYTGDGSLAVITGCQFIGNSAEEGAGISNAQASVAISNCQFIGNSVANGAFPVGGGLNNYICHPLVVDCSFIRNVAELGGGGVYSEGDGPHLYNCSFEGNSTWGEWIGFGGGMMNGYNSTTYAANCVFTGNTAHFGGGVCNFILSHPTLVNCSIAANAADSPEPDVGGGIHTWVQADAAIANCVVWLNTPSGVGGPGDSNASYCDSQELLAGEGNFSTEPFFLQAPWPGDDGVWGSEDDAYGSLQLSPGSPCVDAGDNTAFPAELDSDFAHLPRFADVPQQADLGKPDGVNAIIDIGAFEQQPVVGCPADILPEFGGDGVVDGLDLWGLIEGWGNCHSEAGCPADIAPIGGNAVVDVDDLFFMLSQWGPCGG